MVPHPHLSPCHAALCVSVHAISNFPINFLLGDNLLQGFPQIQDLSVIGEPSKYHKWLALGS